MVILSKFITTTVDLPDLIHKQWTSNNGKIAQNIWYIFIKLCPSFGIMLITLRLQYLQNYLYRNDTIIFKG